MKLGDDKIEVVTYKEFIKRSCDDKNADGADYHKPKLVAKSDPEPCCRLAGCPMNQSKESCNRVNVMCMIPNLR